MDRKNPDQRIDPKQEEEIRRQLEEQWFNSYSWGQTLEMEAGHAQGQD